VPIHEELGYGKSPHDVMAVRDAGDDLSARVCPSMAGGDHRAASEVLDVSI
jgi:hypothetical protein